MSEVGIYKIDITPSLCMDFMGYHLPTGIRSIDEHIFASAFVFEANQTVLGKIWCVYFY
jgi:hypothetical protein